jgi:hypothetical protein
MTALFTAVRVVLAVLALRGVRAAYVAFMALGLLYFPARVGFRLHPRACETALDARLAALSLGNHPHIVLFALCYVLSLPQFRGPRRWLCAGAATLVMGALVELAEGITGQGHCRLRDLVPDATGAALGALVMLAWGGARDAVRVRVAARG